MTIPTEGWVAVIGLLFTSFGGFVWVLIQHILQRLPSRAYATLRQVALDVVGGIDQIKKVKSLSNVDAKNLALRTLSGQAEKWNLKNITPDTIDTVIEWAVAQLGHTKITASGPVAADLWTTGPLASVPPPAALASRPPPAAVAVVAPPSIDSGSPTQQIAALVAAGDTQST